MINQIDRTWTLFLDRDGVINERIPGHYLSSPAECKLTPGCRQAIAAFNFFFGRIVVVTNQAGIAKGITTEAQVNSVHEHIERELATVHGKIHRFYFCPDLANSGSRCRKPATGMADQAKVDFPKIDFSRSVMVGDSISDIKFGKAKGMKTVIVAGKLEEETEANKLEVDLRVENLFEFAQWLLKDQILPI